MRKPRLQQQPWELFDGNWVREHEREANRDERLEKGEGKKSGYKKDEFGKEGKVYH